MLFYIFISILILIPMLIFNIHVQQVHTNSHTNNDITYTQNPHLTPEKKNESNPTQPNPIQPLQNGGGHPSHQSPQLIFFRVMNDDLLT